MTGRAAALISERQDLDTWSELKIALEQHFGDPRSEECIAIELQQNPTCTKVNRVQNVNLRASKITIYDIMAMNVVLYNLLEGLLRIVRLKGSRSLEDALSIVLEEVNFLYQYNTRNKMLQVPNLQARPQQPRFLDKMGIKPLFSQNPQGFKFGIPQTTPNVQPQTQQQPQQRFQFGIPKCHHKLNNRNNLATSPIRVQAPVTVTTPTIRLQTRTCATTQTVRV